MPKMRIALISDLHGNELALDAVLDDATRSGADKVLCLGDIATLGARPREVLARLREIGCDCILGNHDEFMLDPDLIRKYTDAADVVAAVDWCRDQLSPADIAFIRSFVDHVELPLGGGATLYAYHGTPRSNMEDMIATTPPAEVDAMLGDAKGTVYAGGHTHVQMLRQHDGRLILNPGSVGMPFQNYVSGGPPTILPHTEYAIVEGSARGVVTVSLKRVPLDKRALKEQAALTGFPLRDYHMQQYS
jgi:predicted phosphodiesterase